MTHAYYTTILQEIIEFPVLKVNGKNFKTEAVFHQYVQPTVHPDLTPFCTEVRSLNCAVVLVLM